MHHYAKSSLPTRNKEKKWRDLRRQPHPTILILKLSVFPTTHGLLQGRDSVYSSENISSSTILCREWMSTWTNIPWAHFFVKTGCKEIHLCKWIPKTLPKSEIFGHNNALSVISGHSNVGLRACILSVRANVWLLHDFWGSLLFMFSSPVVWKYSIWVANLCCDNPMDLNQMSPILASAQIPL